MSLLSRLEKLEKRAGTGDDKFSHANMEAVLAGARVAIAESKARPPKSLQQQITDVMKQIEQSEHDAETEADWLARELAAIRAECNRRMLAMLEADADLLAAVLAPSDGTEVHG